MKKAIFYAQVKNGKVQLDNKTVFDLYVKNFEGKKIEITVEKEQVDITQSQWAYLFSVVYPAIANETGYSINEVDGVLKKRHLTVNKGLKKEYVKSKSNLKRKELSDFIDLVIRDAAEIGIVVPPANKFWGQENGKKI